MNAGRKTLLLLLLPALLAACSEISSLDPNRAPETTLMVDSTVSVGPTHYMQILSWHGEDPDGEVERYEYRWHPDPSVQDPDFDGQWVGLVEPFVTWERDTFFLPTPEGEASHGFEIRSVDDDGLADPTPAFVQLPVLNHAPRIWILSNGDTTSTWNLPEEVLPVLNLKWSIIDPDDPEGEGALIEEVRFWFEDSLDYISLPGADTLYTLQPEDFGGVLGLERPFHLQAVDRGGALSNVLSGGAYVKDISQVRLLVLDSCDTGSNYGTTADNFWRESVAGSFDPSEVYVHDFQVDGSLGDVDLLNSIFSIFEAILWYNGDAGSADATYFTSDPTPEIQAAEEAVLDYLDAGGNVLVSGWNLLGASIVDQVEPGEPPGPDNYSGGSFSEDLEEDILHLEYLLAHSSSPEGWRSSNYRLYPGREILGLSGAGTETLRNMAALAGIDIMIPDGGALDAGIVQQLYRVEIENLFPTPAEDGSVGLRRFYDSGGELVVLTFPLSLAHGYGNNLDEALGFLEGFGITP